MILNKDLIRPRFVSLHTIYFSYLVFVKTFRENQPKLFYLRWRVHELKGREEASRKVRVAFLADRLGDVDDPDRLVGQQPQRIRMA
jgi:hypothetical protein